MALVRGNTTPFLVIVHPASTGGVTIPPRPELPSGRTGRIQSVSPDSTIQTSMMVAPAVVVVVVGAAVVVVVVVVVLVATPPRAVGMSVLQSIVPPVVVAFRPPTVSTREVPDPSVQG